MEQKKGIFITLEGVEGSGKTTAVQGILEFFSDKYDIYATREPGGSKIAEDIRKVILNPENTDMDPITEACSMRRLVDSISRRKSYPN